MRPAVQVETSIISWLTTRRSRDIVPAMCLLAVVSVCCAGRGAAAHDAASQAYSDGGHAALALAIPQKQTGPRIFHIDRQDDLDSTWARLGSADTLKLSEGAYRLPTTWIRGGVRIQGAGRDRTFLVGSLQTEKEGVVIRDLTLVGGENLYPDSTSRGPTADFTVYFREPEGSFIMERCSVVARQNGICVSGPNSATIMLSIRESIFIRLGAQPQSGGIAVDVPLLPGSSIQGNTFVGFSHGVGASSFVVPYSMEGTYPQFLEHVRKDNRYYQCERSVVEVSG